jgi:hypothetical protein
VLCISLAAWSREVSGPDLFRIEGNFGRLFKGHIRKRHLSVRILYAQPASVVSAGHIQFIRKRPRYLRIRGRSAVSSTTNNIDRGPFLVNFVNSLQWRIFNIRIPLAETLLERTETGSILLSRGAMSLAEHDAVQGEQGEAEGRMYLHLHRQHVR